MAAKAPPELSADPLLDLLRPHLPAAAPPPDPALSSAYLTRLASLPLASILEAEPASLAASLHSLNLSLQKLSARSHKPLIASANHLAAIPASAAALSSALSALSTALPALDSTIATFTATFARDSPALTHRAQTHRLSRNLDRILDILQLPTLLQSLITSSSYPTALDLLSHVRRLHTLYPTSPTITSVATSCDTLQQTLTANLLTTLRGPLKLPTAMKTTGFLRRCSTQSQLDERGLRGLFLVCRSAHLTTLLSSLTPLQSLADHNRAHTERYLKRWIEIFREQSFSIVSMYRSIFPTALPSPPDVSSRPGSPIIGSSPLQGAVPNFSQSLPQSRVGTIRSRSSSTLSTLSASVAEDDPDAGMPPDPLASFVLMLVGMLVDVLGTYLPGVEERSVRESLLTQVLYAAGSLGRLGGEFGAILGVVECFGGGSLGRGDGEEEWVSVVAKHRVLASRLESITGRG